MVMTAPEIATRVAELNAQSPGRPVIRYFRYHTEYLELASFSETLAEAKRELAAMLESGEAAPNAVFFDGEKYEFDTDWWDW